MFWLMKVHQEKRSECCCFVVLLLYKGSEFKNNVCHNTHDVLCYVDKSIGTLTISWFDDLTDDAVRIPAVKAAICI